MIYINYFNIKQTTKNTVDLLLLEAPLTFFLSSTPTLNVKHEKLGPLKTVRKTAKFIQISTLFILIDGLSKNDSTNQL